MILSSSIHRFDAASRMTGGPDRKQTRDGARRAAHAVLVPCTKRLSPPLTALTVVTDGTVIENVAET